MENFEALVKAAEKIRRDENGKVIIEMEAADISDLFSNISAPGEPILSEEAAEFIKNAGADFTSDEKFILKMKGDFKSQEEKEIFCKGTQRYFIQNYLSASRELRRNRFRLAMLFVIGVFILGASYFFKRDLWAEVGDIAAWVLIWKMVDIIAFDNRGLVFEKKRSRAFAEMEIEFE